MACYNFTRKLVVYHRSSSAALPVAWPLPTDKGKVNVNVTDDEGKRPKASCLKVEAINDAESDDEAKTHLPSYKDDLKAAIVEMERAAEDADT